MMFHKARGPDRGENRTGRIMSLLPVMRESGSGDFARTKSSFLRWRNCLNVWHAQGRCHCSKSAIPFEDL